MSGVVRIPQELRDFLELPEPQTLLVRGPPGSGKTTLSLAMLEAFRGNRILISSRVSSAELHREFGWLGSNNGSSSIEIIDTSEMDETVHQVARTLEQARQVLVAPKDRKEREDLKFLWLPTSLQDAWSRLSTTKPSLIVIDSWDALVESFVGGANEVAGPVPDRAEIERLLIRRMAESPAHLVFILEREEQTALDYLVNGVVLTRREVANERLARWVVMMKLRGVRIENAIYPFTLEGGRFESILPTRPYSQLRPGVPERETDHLPGHIWPGSGAFAQSFGRLAFGRMTLIEMDPAASPRVGDLLTYPVVAHVIGAGGRALIVPHSSETPEEIFDILGPSVHRERFVSNVRLMLPPGPIPKGKEDLWRTVLTVPPPTPEEAAGVRPAPGREPTQGEGVRWVWEGASDRSPGLFVVSMQGLTAIAAARGTPITLEAGLRLPEMFTATIRGANVHSILIAQRGSEWVQHLHSIATTRIEVRIQQGRIFLHGLVPWTPSFVLAEGGETKPYDLLRIV